MNEDTIKAILDERDVLFYDSNDLFTNEEYAKAIMHLIEVGKVNLTIPDVTKQFCECDCTVVWCSLHDDQKTYCMNCKKEKKK